MYKSSADRIDQPHYFSDYDFLGKYVAGHVSCPLRYKPFVSYLGEKRRTVLLHIRDVNCLASQFMQPASIPFAAPLQWPKSAFFKK